MTLTSRDGSEKPGPDAAAAALRYALFRRGLGVAGNTGFEPFDLQILLGPVCRVALNTLWERKQRARAAMARDRRSDADAGGRGDGVGVVCGGRQWIPAVAFAAAALLWFAALTLAPLTRLRATLKAALIEAMDRLRSDANIVAEGT